MRKMLLVISCFFLAGLALSTAVRAISVSARSACVYDPLTDRIFYEKEAEKIMPMASITKVMTALVALENYNLDDKVLIKKEYAAVEGSSMYLKEGSEVSVIDLLYGLMLQSGNDAAETLAGHYSGGRSAFVDEMNSTAEKLSLRSTSFENPSGLDGEGHYTTASDFARLAAYAMEHPEFLKIVSSKYYQTHNGVSIKNHNKLLWSCDGAIGIKTGFTKLSGRTLVSCVERGGRRLIAVTLNAPNDWEDHTKMYDEIFALFTETTHIKKGESVVYVPVISGSSGFSKITAAEDKTICLAPEEHSKLETYVVGRHFVYAPVEGDSIYGTLVYSLHGREIAQVALKHTDTISVNDPS